MSADPTQPYSEPSSPLLDSLFGLILPEDRQPYFNKLVTGGFIAMDRQEQWINALQEAECQRLVGWQLCQFKARLDDLIHQQTSGTFPVSKTRYPDMLRRILEALRNGGYPALELPWIQGKTVIDYGCGTYNPLAMGSFSSPTVSSGSSPSNLSRYTWTSPTPEPWKWRNACWPIHGN